jgi:hypothetical protein
MLCRAFVSNAGQMRSPPSFALRASAGKPRTAPQAQTKDQGRRISARRRRSRHNAPSFALRAPAGEPSFRHRAPKGKPGFV